MKKNSIQLLIILFLFLSCDYVKKDDTTLVFTQKNEFEKSKIKINLNSTKENKNYTIKVEQIDSLNYYTHKEKANYKKDVFKKITNFETAKKTLKNIVFFNDNDKDGLVQAILKIRFKNGKEINYNEDLDDCFFVAYFPTEDILLCEGGHSSDVSFNLKNGKETNETGNPDYFITSPNSLFRLNGHFNGQECSSCFIQKKINDDYIKSIQLDEEFEKQTKIWLCIIGEAFWFDNLNLYLTEASNYTENGLNTRYFKIKLIEN